MNPYGLDKSEYGNESKKVGDGPLANNAVFGKHSNNKTNTKNALRAFKKTARQEGKKETHNG
jgi:hypothetical protein